MLSQIHRSRLNTITPAYCQTFYNNFIHMRPKNWQIKKNQILIYIFFCVSQIIYTLNQTKNLSKICFAFTRKLKRLHFHTLHIHKSLSPINRRMLKKYNEEERRRKKRWIVYFSTLTTETSSDYIFVDHIQLLLL